MSLRTMNSFLNPGLGADGAGALASILDDQGRQIIN